MIKTVIVEFHRWEGVSYCKRSDLFHSALNLGFVSLVFSRHRISNRLAIMVAMLEKFMARLGGNDGSVH